jgi:predicted ATPase
MTLNEFEIHEYRGIQNITLGDLTTINVIVGSNNAGKSSLLEAIALACRPFDPMQWVSVARQRELEIPTSDGLWSMFPAGSPLEGDEGPAQTKPMRLRGKFAGGNRHLSARAFAFSNWDSEDPDELTIKLDVKVDEEGHKTSHSMEFKRNTPASTFGGVSFYRCFTVTPVTHRSRTQLVQLLSGIIDLGRKELAVSLLKLFDDKIDDIDISATRGKSIRVKHSDRGVVDLASFGDGMRRSAAFALALTRSQQGILLIDEIEGAIHPTILPEVLSHLSGAAKEANVQIVTTTHSLEAIDALIEATASAPESFSAHFVKREGNTRIVRRYDFDKVKRLRESGVDLR